MKAMATGKRTRNIYDPNSDKPFKLSRSRIENFIRCPRCFYLDRRMGIDKPSMPAFNLNIAVDELLKKEFDIYRAKGEPHPIMAEHGVDAVPFRHPDLDIWRENFKGLQYLHEPTNLLITGAIDDVWVTPNESLIVADYKATSKKGVVTLDDEWKQSYKRQMEIYQWLFRRMGFTVEDMSYFIYANGLKSPPRFDAQLQFAMQLIPYKGNDQWVEPAILNAYECLISTTPPPSTPKCEYCAYREATRNAE